MFKRLFGGDRQQFFLLTACMWVRWSQLGNRVSQQLPKDTSDLFLTSTNTVKPPISSYNLSITETAARERRGRKGCSMLGPVLRCHHFVVCLMADGLGRTITRHLSLLLISHRRADNVSSWMVSTSFFCFPPTIAQASWCAIENRNLHIHRTSTTEPTANGCNVYWQLASRISGQIYDGPLPRAEWGFLSQEICAKHTLFWWRRGFVYKLLQNFRKQK